MRGVTFGVRVCDAVPCISTHTPHARRDTSSITVSGSVKISTHTPHARRDSLTRINIPDGVTFLLTRLMRGVTAKCARFGDGYRDFYSHASCEA